jgi:hypothetical protein
MAGGKGIQRLDMRHCRRRGREKINITVPALTLRRIDDYVASHHVDSHSAFLVKAAEETMRRETAEAAVT